MTTLLGLDVTGRRVVVAGGGPVAARRIAAFLRDGAVICVVAPHVCEDLEEMIGEGRISWAQRDVREDDLDDAWLAITATGSAAVDRQVAAWADARRIWCVNAGVVDEGSARTPAVTRHSDVLVGVISEGPADPARSVSVRDSVAAHLRKGRADLRRRRAPAYGTMGRVTLVGGGPGPIDLLTLRGRQALAEADVVVVDRLGPTGVLEELPRDVEVIDVGKTPGHHPVPQDEINNILVDQARRGRSVVRLKGGDPYVLGRGGEEVLACQAAGVPVTVVPGISSALAVPAVAGIPVTHRGVSTGFHVVTGHDGLTAASTMAVRDGSATVIVLMGVSALGTIARQARAAGADLATPVAIIENGTLPNERITRTTLANAVADADHVGVQAPAVIVIGPAAAADLHGGLTQGSPTPTTDADH